jgi:glycerol-3-phosphate O-acyltransferase
MKREDRERIAVEVTSRVLASYGDRPEVWESAVFDTIYHERLRLEQPGGIPTTRINAAAYDQLYAKALRGSVEDHRDILRHMTRAFVDEVTGHFDPRVYALATRALPPALNVLLNTMSPLRLVEGLTDGMGDLEQQVELGGDVAALQQVSQRGTVVLVPTHLSNMDSILVGYALHRLGLPPFIYGAGLNLFSNRLIGYFMHNLGAYKVDRRKKCELYKRVLKTYAGCTMELGYHNLFFPGGTRSRSGAVESHLKLGLLGMALDAYVHNLRARKERPDVFVVPCTINYQLVLEAETLVDDHLKEVGKSRYIIEDDEFSKPKRVLDFVTKLFSLHSRIHLTFSRPLDVFGNHVDMGGASLDRRGRVVDRRRYVLVDGEPGLSPQRDQEYTHELERAVVRSFRRDTVLSATNVMSYVALRHLAERSPGADLYHLLRPPRHQEGLPLPETYDRLERFLATLRGDASRGVVRLDRTLADKDTVAVANEALAHLASYHRKPALRRRGDVLLPGDRTLLLYYANRVGDVMAKGVVT